MLDKFLEVTYTRSEKEKLRDKVASLTPYRGSDAEGDWVDKFRGTPFLPKAVAILQQEVQLEQQELQAREARSSESEMSRKLWGMKDALQLQKRMLDLELVTGELSGAEGGMPPMLPPQEPPIAPVMEQDASMPPVPPAPMDMKTAAARMRMMKAAGLGAPAAAGFGSRLNKGITSIGRAASKGWRKGGAGDAAGGAWREYANIARDNPLMAGAMAAIPAAAVAAPVAAGYVGGKLSK